MEVYYGILRDYGEDAAEKAYSAAGKYNVEFDDHDIRAAMKKRLEYGKRKVNLSYADALGYEVAQRMGMKFLTGDEAFKGLENVEFVK